MFARVARHISSGACVACLGSGACVVVKFMDLGVKLWNKFGDLKCNLLFSKYL
jgi:hypothetical protein